MASELRIDASSHRWQQPDADPGSYALGMLGIAERKVLHHLARDYLTGEGDIVDLGAFCGASALSFATGLRLNPRAGATRIHSYDIFIADDAYLVDFLRTYMNETLALGDGFEHVFRQAVASHADLIDVHAGDLATFRFDQPRPIECLFIDAAKTLDLNGHIVRHFLPRLIPGRSFIVQQDFFHPGTYYLVVTMWRLRAFVTVLEPRADWTIAYRLDSAIPADLLDEIARYPYGFEEQRSAIEQTIAALGDEGWHLQASLAALIGREHGKPAFDAFVDSMPPPPAIADPNLVAAHQDWIKAFDPARIRRRTGWTA